MGIETSCDVYIISYPKCGRTWLRMLIGHYLQFKYNINAQHILNSNQLSYLTPVLTHFFTHDGTGRWDKDIPTNKTQYATKKVILLRRGIHDILVSSYFQKTVRANCFNGSLSEFIRSKQFGVQHVLRFYNIWEQNKHIPKTFLSITYEQLHADTSNILVQVLNILEEPDICPVAVAKSVKECSFNKLHLAEQNNKYKKSEMQPHDIKNSESYKTRKGKIGGYVDYLTPEDIQYIDQAIRENAHDCT